MPCSAVTTEVKGTKAEWRFSDVCAFSMWSGLCQQKQKGELSFPAPLLEKKIKFSCWWFRTLLSLAVHCHNPLGSPSRYRLSFSCSYSLSQTQCPLPLQHPFQNPIRSIGKNNYKTLPGCQTAL